MNSRIERRKFKSVSRRELLKLTPVVALGAFALPHPQNPLLNAGLGFSDWASASFFARPIWRLPLPLPSSRLSPVFPSTTMTWMIPASISKNGSSPSGARLVSRGTILSPRSRPCPGSAITRGTFASRAGT